MAPLVSRKVLGKRDPVHTLAASYAGAFGSTSAFTEYPVTSDTEKPGDKK